MRLRKRSEASSTPEKGPHYDKRLLDPSRLTMGATVRRYWRDHDGSWHYDDIEITRNEAFMHQGSLWTAGRDSRTGRQEYYSLRDMGIVVRGNGSYNPGTYTILLKPGRQK